MPLREGAWQVPSAVSGYRGLQRIASRFLVGTVGLGCKFWLEWMNKAKVHNHEILMDLIDNRPKDQGLLTISNHTSCIDDPIIWGLLKPRHVMAFDKMRYTSAAEDVCFKNKSMSIFFSLGRVFPLVRGDGVYQRGMDYTIEHLDLGNWCHIFPEGKVNLTKEFMRIKWGVGRLIADCKKTPLVLPIWHVGMDSILPNSRPYIPRIRKQVTVLVGKPLDFASEVESLKSSKKSPREIRKHLTDLVQEEFRNLKERAEMMHKDLTSTDPSSSSSS